MDSAMPPEVAVLLQPKGLLHRFIRHKDVSNVVERPERLRAVSVGVAAAQAALEIGRNESPSLSHPQSVHGKATSDAPDHLADAIKNLTLDERNRITHHPAFLVLTANSSSNSLTNAAIRFVHGEHHEYLSKLLTWASTSEEKIKKGESEIPEGLSQGDLFLCPQSVEALSGAVSAVCQAVDLVLRSSLRIPAESSVFRDEPDPRIGEGRGVSQESATKLQDPVCMDTTASPMHHLPIVEPQKIPLPPSPPSGTIEMSKNVDHSNLRRVFVGVRPPGHHCSEDTPSGFCFINNVLIAAAHAHIRYDVKRAVILDIDLHHGNGTQAIAWSINAETAQREAEFEGRSDVGEEPLKPGLKVFYGSLHDILSFPCEDGEMKATQAASTVLRGAHGQYIQNIHLQPYEDEADFFSRLYPSYLDGLLGGARQFLQATEASLADTMVYISAGFDASLHEHAYMSRHKRNVPTAFYSRFVADVRRFADEYCNGRIVAVLEGGYSDRALISGSGAFMQGLAADLRVEQELTMDWWDVDRLGQLEKLTKLTPRGSKARSSRTASETENPWLGRVQQLINAMDSSLFTPLPPIPTLKPPSSFSVTPLPNMTLRGRKKLVGAAPTPSSQPKTRTSNKLQSTVVAREQLRVEPESSLRLNDVMATPPVPSSDSAPHSTPPALQTSTGAKVHATGSDREPLKIRIKVPPKARPREDQPSTAGTTVNQTTPS